jgi:Trpc4-associated protein
MNLATMMADRECGVRTVRTLGHLPNGVQKRLDREYDNLPNFVLTLAETHLKGDLAMVRDKIRKVSDVLNVNMAGDGNSLRENFVLFGGAHVVVRCLQVPVNSEEAKHSGWRGALAQEKIVWDLRKDCLGLLRDLCYGTPVLSEQLCSQPNFIVFLFSLMRNQSTFDEAVSLTEEVLAFRGEIFNLSLVPDFEGLVKSFSKRQMAFFCRVLALVVFEPEDRPSEELKITKASDLLTARREQALSPAVKNTDRNHAVLLGIDELLPRMVKLVLVHAAPHQWADELMQHLPATHLNHYDLFANILGGGGEDSNDWDEEPSAAGFFDNICRICLSMLVQV